MVNFVKILRSAQNRSDKKTSRIELANSKYIEKIIAKNPIFKGQKSSE